MRARIWLAAFLVVGGCRPEAAGPRSEPVRPVDAPGLHNVFRVSDRVYSGSGPDGDAGFAAVRELGVKTIISVDGARPDVEAARRHGLAYVHLPFGYDGIPRGRVLALVKAAGLPGPLYVHCHHGRHRGPAAVAVIQLCTDPAWDADRAEEWLRTAGTDPRYTGLTGLPRTLVRPTAAELATVPADLPATAVVPDLARIMVEVDARCDHLKLVKATGWRVPPGHPDIDPPHEALQLAEHYREAGRLDDTRRRGTEFARLIEEAGLAATDLEQALRARPVDPDRADQAFARSAAACAGCHGRFRDRPAGPPERASGAHKPGSR